MTGAELREWINVFLPEVVSDGQGGYTETIPTGLVYDRPAAVREVSGGEVTASDQLAQRVRYEVTIRRDQGITPSHRIWWRDMYLDITNVEILDMRDTWLKLDCVQREAGAQ